MLTEFRPGSIHVYFLAVVLIEDTELLSGWARAEVSIFELHYLKFTREG